MIIDIRGTHGSGKSWIVHQLISLYGSKDILDLAGNPIGHNLSKCSTAIVGRYDRVCGGCDGIKTADEVCNLTRRFARQYSHVILEGILVAHTFKRYSNLANELGNYTFCFLDTPLKTCIQRVKQRRIDASNHKPFNNYWLKYDWHRIWGRFRNKFADAGHDVLTLDHKNPMPVILELMQCRG
jgi:hypothetical protein